MSAQETSDRALFEVGKRLLDSGSRAFDKFCSKREAVGGNSE